MLAQKKKTGSFNKRSAAIKWTDNLEESVAGMRQDGPVYACKWENPARARVENNLRRIAHALLSIQKKRPADVFSRAKMESDGAAAFDRQSQWTPILRLEENILADIEFESVVYMHIAMPFERRVMVRCLRKLRWLYTAVQQTNPIEVMLDHQAIAKASTVPGGWDEPVAMHWRRMELHLYQARLTMEPEEYVRTRLNFMKAPVAHG